MARRGLAVVDVVGAQLVGHGQIRRRFDVHDAGVQLFGGAVRLGRRQAQTRFGARRIKIDAIQRHSVVAVHLRT